MSEVYIQLQKMIRARKNIIEDIALIEDLYNEEWRELEKLNDNLIRLMKIERKQNATKN